MASEPLVIFRRDNVKVVLITDRTQPLIVTPSRTTSVTIRRSDIPGVPGAQGERGEKGAPGDVGGLPSILDGGFA